MIIFMINLYALILTFMPFTKRFTTFNHLKFNSTNSTYFAQ